MDAKLIDALHRRIASTSVGPSTARGMGPKGTIEAARKYLAELKLNDFRRPTEREFQTTLDRATERLVKHLPRGAKNWGAARKFLNIFLRGVVYDRFLCEHYDLYGIEKWLELPLDSHAAQGLCGERGGKILHKEYRWTTVIGLTEEKSRKYQEFANGIAKMKKTHRVHLDILYWRHNGTKQ